MSLTPEIVIERLFTTENPETGTVPPPHMAWVVFANGTAFFTVPSDDAPLGADASALRETALRVTQFGDLSVHAQPQHTHGDETERGENHRERVS